MGLYKEIVPSDLVKGYYYYLNTTNHFDKFTVIGRYECTRFESDGEHYDEVIFCPINGNTKKMHKLIEPWLLEIYKYSWVIDPKKIKFYLPIRRKIYNEKLKEKYNEYVLKIVLKKIVNEDFEWY